MSVAVLYFTFIIIILFIKVFRQDNGIPKYQTNVVISSFFDLFVLSILASGLIWTWSCAILLTLWLVQQKDEHNIQIYMLQIKIRMEFSARSQSVIIIIICTFVKTKNNKRYHNLNLERTKRNISNPRMYENCSRWRVIWH